MKTIPASAMLVLLSLGASQTQAQTVDLSGSYSSQVQPLVKQYCAGCHSAEKHKGGLDLERFSSLTVVRKDVKPWQTMIEMIEAREMPPKGKPQPTEEERKRLIEWIHSFLNAEALARAGDPGFVPIRRLSNAEYDYTIRDLTKVDLQPAKEFPADGAGGEGFTNAAESLADMSPTLLNKYLIAAKDIASHTVLLPDGFRFSAGKTRRDWANESVEQLRAFYAEFCNADGSIALQPYVRATIRHRDALKAGQFENVATQEHLDPKYLGVLFKTLSSDAPSYPLDSIRARWKVATEKESDAIASEIAIWQERLWKVVAIGSYREGASSRQTPNNASIAETQTIRLALKPQAGQNDMTLYLSARDLFPGAAPTEVIWSRPRLEAPNKPALLLKDYPKFGPAYEVDYAAVFADSAKYLGAVVEAVNDPKTTIEDVAKRNGLDTPRLKRWIELVSIEPVKKGGGDLESVARPVERVALELLTDLDKNPQRPAVNGFHKKGSDLPVVVSNSSDTEEHIPGRAAPHKVLVHPTPTEFVAIAWKSPIDGRVRVTGKVEHVHVGCGNSIAWFLEHRTADRTGVLAEGALNIGGQAPLPLRFIKVAKGDTLLLAVDAKGDHSCDLSEVNLNIADSDKPARTWDLSSDVANDILEGNPHADKQGNKDVWSFVKGPTRSIATAPAGGQTIPVESVLGKWRIAASDPARKDDAAKLAEQVQALLSGAHPAKEKVQDAALFDSIVSGDGPLLHGLDLSSVNKGKAAATHFGVEAAIKFGVDGQGKPIDDASIAAGANSVIQIRLPATLASEKELVVECKLAAAAGDRATQFEVRTSPPIPAEPLSGNAPVVASATGAAMKKLVQGLNDFRDCFPKYACYPNVLPVDEVVCLKMYHREDEPLERLFLNAEQKKQIDYLWEEHRFIGQQPLAENKYLPLFIGFVTQDQPKELLQYFEGQRPAFKQRSDVFEKDWQAAAPKQLEKLADFAGQAFRRPLSAKERTDLVSLYQALRAKGVSHEEAFDGVVARILVSPSFLFKLETPPATKVAGSVNDWELATRLSYFLWSSVPDAELRQAAASGKLHDPNVLAAQTQRMLKDPRTRSLGIEFGTQWIHVRGFDAFNEKSEKLYPTFDEKLRTAIYEESILFFQDIFKSDQPVTRILDANYTFLNEDLAKHYNIPNVTGPQWRKVDDVRKYGRGGILALASVQAKQAGAARTSPVLRGNWVVETLLGEKLPRPPADVPKLPEEEGASNLTMRQLVEKHVSNESCAVCHQRMDPLGFSFERYDAIGRLRDKESTGLAIDAHAKLKDGTQFEGLDGLRNYLLTKKKDVIVRLFCKRLLGYALGRSVGLSDQTLLDRMVAAVEKNEGKTSAAVLEIVKSEQFQKIRGSQYAEAE